ncbi:acyl-CoA dehydrogenase family protein [Xylophilus sp. GW821-FHT01B05]
MTVSLLRQPAPSRPGDDLGATLSALRTEFASRAADYDHTGAFPHANFARLHEHGLLSLAVPAAHGGADAPLSTLAQVVGEIARGDPSTALVLVMQYIFHNLAGRSAGWPEHLRARVFGDAIAKGALLNGLRVEPELGTPARGGLPDTVARLTPEGWRISGRKIYSTGSPGLTWLTVWARSDEAVPRVGGWLVHHDTPGVRIVENWDHLGMRATGSHEVVFDNVLTPLDHALDIRPVEQLDPRLDTQFAVWNSVLIGTVYNAVAREARDWFAGWLQDRKPANLGAPLASLPRFQEALGRIDALLFANRRLLDAAIAGPTSAADVSLTKYLVTGNAISAVELAVELTGNPGLSRGSPLERHFRNVLCSRVHTPQNDTILVNAGKAALSALAAERLAASASIPSTGAVHVS